MRHINLRLKVFATDGKTSQAFMLPVPRYADAQAHANAHELSNFIQLLKAQFPGNEFKVVPAGRNRWNVLPQPLSTDQRLGDCCRRAGNVTHCPECWTPVLTDAVSKTLLPEPCLNPKTTS